MTEHSGLHLYHWIKQINSVVPPLCVELFLKDNRTYFLHSVCYWEDIDPIAVLRIWDLRNVRDDQLAKAMAKVRDRNEYCNEEKIHPKLDWANLRLPKECIAYAIEWHDRLWGESLGFQSIGEH